MHGSTVVLAVVAAPPGGELAFLAVGGLLGMGLLDRVRGDDASADAGTDDGSASPDEGDGFFNDPEPDDLGGMESLEADADPDGAGAGDDDAAELAARVDDVEGEVERLAAEIGEVEDGTAALKEEVREIEETIGKMDELRDQIHDLGW